MHLHNIGYYIISFLSINFYYLMWIEFGIIIPIYNMYIEVCTLRLYKNVGGIKIYVI